MLKTVEFHRDHVLMRPKREDLPTMADRDESKLPLLDRLLREMWDFHEDLRSVGLSLQSDKGDRHPRNNLFRLMDTEYANWPFFEIRAKSDWLDPKIHHLALHAGFKFSLSVTHDGFNGSREVADWIDVCIEHVNVVPFSFASYREHVRALGCFHDPKASYFHDLPMDFTATVNFGNMDRGMTFKTVDFRKAVEDACTVLRKIRSRKKHLMVHPGRD